MDHYLTSSPQELDSAISRYGHNINKNSGFYWWKRYTYAAIWSLSATPINLFITIFTALTTAQTTTGSLLGDNTSALLGISTLVLSVVNTFFKPYNQLIVNQGLKEKWAEIGIEFESIYYSPAHNDVDKKEKLRRLSSMWDKVCNLKKNDDNNYLIDVIFLISKIFCIRKNINWLPSASDEYKKERLRALQQQTTPTHPTTPPHHITPPLQLTGAVVNETVI